MTPAGAYSTTPVGSAPTTLSTLASGGCMRAAAMAAESGVELSLVDAEGKVVATDRDPAFALVPAGGPLCPRGALTLRARRLGGDGLIFWQTWSTR